LWKKSQNLKNSHSNNNKKNKNKNKNNKTRLKWNWAILLWKNNKICTSRKEKYLHYLMKAMKIKLK
jgi:hypothetical protein